MKRLAHPNIVAFKDSFFADGKGSLCIVRPRAARRLGPARASAAPTTSPAARLAGDELL